MGVWIEISIAFILALSASSLPAWECGLKSDFVEGIRHCVDVTPCVGVWIEIKYPNVIIKGRA